ncbi:hypothetical protein ACFTWS_12795 [Streptomyces sp. NPDC057027]|uniref:hypothetical protein n=1 Tax=Streptomyces sp. NPDC057027 TaxID=3346004 RepID=UPI0036433975
MPVGGTSGTATARRIAAGCRAVGADRVRCLASGDTPAIDLRPTETDLAGIAPPALLLTPDQAGALLFPEPGYALVTGSEAFLAAAVAEGSDAARANGERTGGNGKMIDCDPIPYGDHERAIRLKNPTLGELTAARENPHEG